MGIFDGLFGPESNDSAADNYSSTGDDRADAVSNRSGGSYDKADASTETGCSSRDTSSAWHTARDDYQRDEGLGDRHDGGWQDRYDSGNR